MIVGRYFRGQAENISHLRSVLVGEDAETINGSTFLNENYLDLYWLKEITKRNCELFW